MPPFRFLLLPILVFLGASSGLLIPEKVEAEDSPSTKVATIPPSLMIPISSCNSLRVLPPQGHGGVWLKPSLESPRSRPQCVSNGLIGKTNETALYGTFTTILLTWQLIRVNIKSVSRFRLTVRDIARLNSTSPPRVIRSNGQLEVPEF